MTVFWKTDHLHTRTEIHLCLYIIAQLMHYSETPITRQYIARSAFTDGFLPMLLNHESAFHGPGEHCMGYQTAPYRNLGLPGGFYQFMSHTEGTVMLFESKWVL